MSELFGNPEQLGELSGNPEQLPYTPTTEEIRLRYSDSRHWGEELDAQFDRWLAEVKAQAWEKGFQGGHDSAMGVSNTKNPYRQREEQ